MRIRQIQTRPVLQNGQPLIRDGKPVVEPVLDEQGQEIELASIEIPLDVESAGPEFVEAYLTDPEGTLAAIRGPQATPTPAPAAPALMIPEPVAQGSPTLSDPEE